MAYAKWHISRPTTQFAVANAMSISDDLYKALEKALERETLYRTAKESGVNYAVLHRFLSGERPTLRLETVDRIADYLGLKLKRPTKRRKKR